MGAEKRTSPSAKVSIVPPTREVRDRVITKYFPSKCSMFWNDKKNRVYREWHGTVRGSKLTIVEGICGEPLTRTVRDYGSAAAANQAYKDAELEQYKASWQRVSKGIRTDFFFVAPPKKGVKRTPVDTTPVPARIGGYASDGRMVADIAKLLPDAKKLGRKLPTGTAASLAQASKALPKALQKALIGLTDACTRGKLRELSWNFTLGFRLAGAFKPEELAEVLGHDKKALALAADAIEIVHDGGLAHYVACKDGVRVYNNEGGFEGVITPSVDAFMWALVHRTAVEAGTYDAKAYAVSLKKLAIKRELPLKKK